MYKSANNASFIESLSLTDSQNCYQTCLWYISTSSLWFLNHSVACGCSSSSLAFPFRPRFFGHLFQSVSKAAPSLSLSFVVPPSTDPTSHDLWETDEIWLSRLLLMLPLRCWCCCCCRPGGIVQMRAIYSFANWSHGLIWCSTQPEQVKLKHE